MSAMSIATEATMEPIVIRGFKNARERSRRRSALNSSRLFLGVESLIRNLGSMQNAKCKMKNAN